MQKAKKGCLAVSLFRLGSPLRQIRDLIAFSRLVALITISGTKYVHNF